MVFCLIFSSFLFFSSFFLLVIVDTIQHSVHTIFPCKANRMNTFVNDLEHAIRFSINTVNSEEGLELLKQLLEVISSAEEQQL